MAGAIQGFTATGLSLVAALRHCDAEVRHEAFAGLVSIYWKPVYKYLRVRWSVPKKTAEDLTQQFLTTVLRDDCARSRESGFAAFRSHVRLCLDSLAEGHLKPSLESDGRATTPVFSLNFERAESELSSPPGDGWRISRLPGEKVDPPYRGEDPGELFHRECLRALFHDAVDEFERQCGTKDWQVFEIFARFDLDPPLQRPTYSTLSIELGLTTEQVVSFLESARDEFRALALRKLASVCASDAEFQREASYLLGTACPLDNQPSPKLNAYLLVLPLVSSFLIM